MSFSITFVSVRRQMLSNCSDGATWQSSRSEQPMPSTYTHAPESGSLTAIAAYSPLFEHLDRVVDDGRSSSLGWPTASSRSLALTGIIDAQPASIMCCVMRGLQGDQSVCDLGWCAVGRMLCYLIWRRIDASEDRCRDWWTGLCRSLFFRVTARRWCAPNDCWRVCCGCRYR